MLHPQGMNLSQDAFSAVGDMLSSAEWALPMAQEYRNELSQPSFLGLEACPQSTSQTMVATQAKNDPAGPAIDEQWKKINKMVA